MDIRALLIAAVASACAVVETDTIEREATAPQWSKGVKAPRTKPFDGTLHVADFNHKVASIYRDADSTALIAASFDGKSWTSLASTGQTTDYGPALAVFQGKLTSVDHAGGRLVMSTSTDGATWTSPATAGTSPDGSVIRHAPAATVEGGMLYVAYCTSGPDEDHVRIDRFDGSRWSRAAQWDIGPACRGVSIASLPDGRVQVVFNTESLVDGRWYLYEVRGFGPPSSSWVVRTLPMRSATPPSVLSCNGVTHLVHGGESASEIWWTVHDGGDWLDAVRMPSQGSNGGATLGCLGTRAFMFHTDDDSQLWWSEYRP